MIPALLETIGALSLLLSVAAKIALLRDDSLDDAPTPSAIPHACAACCSRRARCEAHRGGRERAPLSARCARAAAGRAAFARTRRHG
ncbi:hypothetical protein AWB78_02731 [Caballeronia calidae]|uniref:Uncharacterized protein n=1 Tax=Caballeronia calidae TaxID=1777139 RepID=A0A158BIL0_9BURK|nr:hypothetical protein AWB78_02731 [Caballeronia calidae]